MEDYESVVCLADMQHFGRAAQTLGISQPALTVRIRRLERKLGVTLFTRGRQGARPTAAGLAFAQAARQVVGAAVEARTAAVLAHAGHGQPLAIGLTSIAAQLLGCAFLRLVRTACPRLSISLREGSTSRLERMLEDGEIDAALLHPPLHGPGLAEVLLGEHPVRAAIGPELDGPDGASLPLASTAAAGLITYQRAGAPVLMGQLYRTVEAAGGRVSVLHTADTATAALVLAGAGYGVALVPEGMQLPPGVQLRSVPEVTTTLHTVLAWRRNNCNAALRDVAEAARTFATTVS